MGANRKDKAYSAALGRRCVAGLFYVYLTLKIIPVYEENTAVVAITDIIGLIAFVQEEREYC